MIGNARPTIMGEDGIKFIPFSFRPPAAPHRDISPRISKDSEYMCMAREIRQLILPVHMNRQKPSMTPPCGNLKALSKNPSTPIAKQ